jgi:hypothetical protein
MSGSVDCGIDVNGLAEMLDVAPERVQRLMQRWSGAERASHCVDHDNMGTTFTPSGMVAVQRALKPEWKIVEEAGNYCPIAFIP